MFGTVLMFSLSTTVLIPAQFPLEVIFPSEIEILLPPIPCPCVVPFNSSTRSSLKPREAKNLVLLWNDVTLNAIKTERTPPPVAVRNLAMVHLAIYDSVQSIHRSYQPFYMRTRGSLGVSPEASAAVAAHRVLSTLYPKQIATLDEALDASLDSIPDGPAKLEGITWGLLVAEEILDWRERDTLAKKSTYQSGNEPGHWQATAPKFRPPLLPEWGKTRTFAVKNREEFQPSGPPALTSEEFLISFREVKAIGSVKSQERTAEQTEIAYFWADGEGTVTPPGHWNRIAATIAQRRKLDLSETSRLFAMLNVAMADTAIICWDCKFRFDFWRPVTAIRDASRLNDKEIQSNPDWLPLLETPPFPAYTSGHSSFSGAAAAVLAEFFGSDQMEFITTSDALPKSRRSFSRFSEAANEAGMSRIYGGIHWSFDNTDGLESGKKVGQYVARNYFRATSSESARRKSSDR